MIHERGVLYIILSYRTHYVFIATAINIPAEFGVGREVRFGRRELYSFRAFFGVRADGRLTMGPLLNIQIIYARIKTKTIAYTG